MKIIADESVNYFFVLELRKKGYQILSVAENYPSIEDEDILSISLNPPAIVITEDKDFGELVFRHKKKFVSVILLRYNPSEATIIFERLFNLLEKYVQELFDAFVTVTVNKTRIKHL